MTQRILTVGYGNRSLQDVIALLRSESVEFLVDVRSLPQSKFNLDFCSERLAAGLQHADIRYVFMGDSLGGRPPDTSCYENGHVIYDRVRERQFFKDGVNRLLRALDQDLNLCLLCSEKRPEQCHRSK